MIAHAMRNGTGSENTTANNTPGAAPRTHKTINAQQLTIQSLNSPNITRTIRSTVFVFKNPPFCFVIGTTETAALAAVLTVYFLVVMRNTSATLQVESLGRLRSRSRHAFRFVPFATAHANSDGE